MVLLYFSPLLKSLKTKSLTFLAFSLITHTVLILFVVSGKLPNDKQDNKKKTINSYITFKHPQKAISKPQDTAIEASNDASEQSLKKLKVAEEDKALAISNNSLVEPEKISVVQEISKPPVANPENSFTNIQNVTSQYIEGANKVAMDRLSSSSLKDSLAPKTIINKSRLPIPEQIQQELNASFAPIGTDIKVVSQIADETLILLGNACFKVKETALDSRLYRGAPVWTRSSGCGDVDKFNGQLQMSLDKYLNK